MKQFRMRSAISKRLNAVHGADGVIQPSRIISGAKKQEYRYQSNLPVGTSIDNEENKWQDVPNDEADVDNVDGEEDAEDVDDMDNGEINLDSIISGEDGLPISHAGGELIELLLQQMRRERSKKPRDLRDRKDRIQQRNNGFSQQLNDMTNSYLYWSSSNASEGLWDINIKTTMEHTQASYEVVVIDIFGQLTQSIPLIEGNKGIVPALIRHGLVPCAPYTPHLAITIRTLEYFRVLSLSCARLAIQHLVKSLCTMLAKPYAAHLNKQLSICQDVYLQILGEVERRIEKVLGRDGDLWRLKHACPPCTYYLQGEAKLDFTMLITMDGNNSLKRIPKREGTVSSSEDNDGEIHLVGPTNELSDQRKVSGDYYISREEVENWATDLKKKTETTNNNSSTTLGKRKAPEDSTTIDPVTDTSDTSPCAKRWTNMSDKKTSKAWGIFDETGVFVSLCRHGFVLTVADMVKSGEGSQYALATVERLIKTFGSQLGVGYDIGCRFIKTLLRSSLGPLAMEKRFRSLVGSFHGHAHNRLCQLDYLATYVKGLGLSDLEGAERLFSRTNDLAASTRHASAFHRQQRISHYLKHLNETDTYESLSKFLTVNYKRALDILANTPVYERAKAELKVDETFDFQTWLDEEKLYLNSRLKEPPEDSFEIEYLQRLIKLSDVREKLSSSEQWFVETPITGNTMTASTTAKKEQERRHLKEIETMEQGRIQELELKLGILHTWQEGDNKWMNAMDKMIHQEYRLCLDKLERLVVQRLFELGDMNCSGTGYNQRQQISLALTTRCKAIRSALDQYNKAAKRLSPPRDTLRWEEVVDYAFLSEFDLLANSRVDIREKMWARPASRRLMDLHFKMDRAKEEIDRLNVEIPRFISYMHDEEKFLISMEAQYHESEPQISHQIHLRRIRFELANRRHLSTLRDFVEKHNLDISLTPGIAVNHISGKTPSDVNDPTALIDQCPISTSEALIDRACEDFQAEDEEDTEETALQEDLEIILLASQE